jgi:hypothetical protein
MAAPHFGTLPWHPMVQLFDALVWTSSNMAMHLFGTIARDGNRSYLARPSTFYCLTFSLMFLSDYVIHVTPMIPNTITSSGQDKNQDECAALGEGFAAHVYVGLYGDIM